MTLTVPIAVLGLVRSIRIRWRPAATGVPVTPRTWPSSNLDPDHATFDAQDGRFVVAGIVVPSGDLDVKSRRFRHVDRILGPVAGSDDDLELDRALCCRLGMDESDGAVASAVARASHRLLCAGRARSGQHKLEAVVNVPGADYSDQGPIRFYVDPADSATCE